MDRPNKSTAVRAETAAGTGLRVPRPGVDDCVGNGPITFSPVRLPDRMGDRSLLELPRFGGYRQSVNVLVRRMGIRAYVRTVYVMLYRLRYGKTVPLEVGPASADIGIESAAELSNIRNTSGKERRVAKTLVAELNENDVFWDVGANVGTFACLAGDVVETGTVVAFEPYPPNVERLRQNFRRNGISGIIESRALSDVDGERTFFVMDTDEPGTREGSIEERYAATDDAVRSITVETTAADHAVSAGTYPPPNVVKIDVEGAAPEVLAGMSETLDRQECRLLVVEPHDNEAAIEDVLADAGFRTRTLRVDGSTRIVADRPE